MFIYCVPGCNGHSSSHPHGHGKGRNFTRGCHQKNLDGGLQGTDCEGKFVSRPELQLPATSCKLERGQSRQIPWTPAQPWSKGCSFIGVSRAVPAFRGLGPLKQHCTNSTGCPKGNTLGWASKEVGYTAGHGLKQCWKSCMSYGVLQQQHCALLGDPAWPSSTLPSLGPPGLCPCPLT